MDFSAIVNIFEQIKSFLFESYAGIAILFGGCILITLCIAAALEIKTRKQYVDHPKEEEEEEDGEDGDEEDVGSGNE